MPALPSVSTITQCKQSEPQQEADYTLRRSNWGDFTGGGNIKMGAGLRGRKEGIYCGIRPAGSLHYPYTLACTEQEESPSPTKNWNTNKYTWKDPGPLVKGMQPTMDHLPRANLTFPPLFNPLMKSLPHLSNSTRSQKARTPKDWLMPIGPLGHKAE